jgi:hypothetical protein
VQNAPRRHPGAAALALGFALAALPSAAGTDACIALYKKGVLQMPFNAAMLNVSTFRGPDGTETEGLLMASFFNTEKDPTGERVINVMSPDLVARIADINALTPAAFAAAGGTISPAVEVLSDRDGSNDTVWPNKSELLPPGMVPFQAVLVAAGFLSASRPGHLTLVNLDDPRRQEYVVDPINETPPRCADGQVENQRWYYHQGYFHDMDGDGLKDIVTVRSAFKPFQFRCPPVGELLYFRNPGAALKADVPWEARVLVGLPAERAGPEINFTMRDLDGDAVPEIIATHFTTSDHITVFGAPAGGVWADASAAKPLRRKVIMTGQGRPFGVQASDLNRDGRLDIIATNHQGDGCFANTRDAIPGRVIAIEQPASGRLFDDEWPLHILKDNIRPNPTVPVPVRPPGRLAPNTARAFWPVKWQEGFVRPWIVVSGDEASKVWVLKPVKPRSRTDWRYESVVIFDINDHYGPGTTQQIRTEKPRGEVISTIGGLDWRYDQPGPFGRAEIYAPVFEAQQIHVFSTRPGSGAAVRCPADSTVACPD